MKDLCPFRFVIQKPNFGAPQTFPAVEILKKKSEDNGYLAIFDCFCKECSKEFEVRMEANPYYETYIWPKTAACDR